MALCLGQPVFTLHGRGYICGDMLLYKPILTFSWDIFAEFRFLGTLGDLTMWNEIRGFSENF